MYSLIAFFITFLELAIVVGSHLAASHNAIYMMLVYGSPFYLLMNLLNSSSAFLDKNPIYVALLAFHLIKYIIIFQAQRVDDRNFMRFGAIVIEALYLCLSAYYIN